MIPAFAFIASSRPGSCAEERHDLAPPMIDSGGLDLDGAACKIGERFKWVGLGRNRESQCLRSPCRKSLLVSR